MEISVVSTTFLCYYYDFFFCLFNIIIILLLFLLLLLVGAKNRRERDQILNMVVRGSLGAGVPWYVFTQLRAVP